MSRSLSSSSTSSNERHGWSGLEQSEELLLSSGDEGLAEIGCWSLDRSSVVLARKSILWARDSLERLPIKLTLENVGVIALILAVLMPRALTYALVYPIFRLVFGTLYPAYASYKAVRTKNVKEYVKWMMYWIVFALFTCAETFTDVFFSFWFPFYYEIKIILVLWLLSPATKGSSILYRRFVHPALCRREAEIDEALARATEQGYSAVLQLGTKGVNYATTVLMQTAIKSLPSVVSSGALAASQSDSALSSSARRRASPSASETDGPTTARTATSPESSESRARPRRPIKPELVLDVTGDQEEIMECTESDGEVGIVAEEDLELDYEPSLEPAHESQEEAPESLGFEKPGPVKPKPRKARDDSITRRKPRTRGRVRGERFDSDFSD